MNRYINIFFCSAIFTLGLSQTVSAAKKKWVESYGFEQKSLPSNWISKSDLNSSNKHYKKGTKSLYWNYSSNETIVVSPKNQKITKQKRSGVELWIYNENSSEDQLECTALIGNQRAHFFNIKLNFKGWRSFWIQLNEDAGVAAKDFVTTGWSIELKAPNNNGNIYIDDFVFTSDVSWKRNTDPNLLIKNKITKFNTEHPWKFTGYWSRTPVKDASSYAWTSEVAKEIETIQTRYDDWVLGSGNMKYKPYADRWEAQEKFIAKGKAMVEKYNIVRHKDGTLTGKPLYTMRAEEKPVFSDISKDILLPLALDYKLHHNQKSLDTYLLILDYMHDQGWANESALGTLDHEMLRHAGYFHSIYILRDELKQQGIFDREMQTAKWYLNWNEIYNLPKYNGTTADFMRTLFMYRLLVIMAEDNGAEKARDMSCYQKWINRSMQVSPGFMDTFKPDYTGYHHRGVYMNAYAPNAYHMASVISYLLHDTQYAIGKKQNGILKKAVLTAYYMSCKFHIPYSVSGRMPDMDRNFNNIAPSLAYLSFAYPQDKEILSAFNELYQPNEPYVNEQLIAQADSHLEYYNTLGAIDVMKRAKEKADQTQLGELNIDHNWFKPYAGMMIHRRDDWMVTVKGHSAYIWDYESGHLGENEYGHFMSRDAIQSFTISDAGTNNASGYVQSKGWDWTRLPGTTAPHVPLDLLHSENKGVSAAYKEGQHRNFSDQVFLGGASDGKNGVFGNKLHDCTFDPTFRARKSIFFFNDMIVALGDGIESEDQQFPLETTITQVHKNNHLPKVDQKEIKENTNNTKLSDGTHWIKANDENVYYIPKGQEIYYHYTTQHSMLESGKAPSVGDYFTLWINHGKAPNNGNYEYAFFVRGDANALKQKYTSKKPYKVVECDEAAHIVKVGSKTGMAIWDPETFKPQQEIVRVTTPSLIYTKKKQNELRLTLSDPDLRRPKLMNMSKMEHTEVIAPAYMQKVRVTIKGDWKLDKSNKASVILVDHSSKETTLEFACIDGESYSVNLKSRGNS